MFDNLTHSIDSTLLNLLANGFLPTRGTWMLDFVAVAMVVVVVAMGVSIVQVRDKQNPRVHRAIQLVTAAVLLVALIAFEVDMQFITDWRELAKPSPYYESGMVGVSLAIHLVFAIPTPVIWGFVIYYAMRKFPENYRAGNFNKTHRIWGRIAAMMMLMTAVTGWIFYILAFAM